MKQLLLNGHGISMWVDSAKLHIKDGRFSPNEDPILYIYAPKRIDVENIVIYGNSGNISLDAIKWLIKHNVQISILNWDGKLLTTMLPPESVQVKTKFAQYHAFENQKLRISIARKFLEAKFQRTQFVLDWLKERYPTINNDFSKELSLFGKGKSIANLMMVEGRIASHYWQNFTQIVPENYEFESREYQKRPWGAGDAINCMLNYGYALLEAECMKAINSAGLDCHVGFLHEMRIGKNSLAYDLQEPFRFLIDLAVINIIENKSLDKKDFIRTENYNLRLRPTGAKKILAEIERQFTNKVSYKGQMWAWRYIIRDKATELAYYLLGKSKKIDFSDAKLELNRIDNQEIREKIAKIPYNKWRNMGFSKGSLHYLKQNAKSDKPFKIYEPMMEKIIEMSE